jgi:hypothetical protein
VSEIVERLLERTSLVSEIVERLPERTSLRGGAVPARRF